MNTQISRRGFMGVMGGAAGAAALSPSAVFAQSAQIDLGTMNVGSAWYQYGVLLSQYFQRALPEGSTVNVRDFAGGDGNLRLIEADDRVQAAFTFSMNVAWARRGMTDISDATAENVRLLAGGMDQYYIGMMALDSIGVETLSEAIAEERGLQIATTPPGSSGDIGVSLLLRANGIDEDTLNQWGGGVSRVSLQAASENMVTGRADVWVNMLVPGHPRTTELAFGHPLRFLGLSDEAMAAMTEFGLNPAELPAGTFEGQDESVMLPGTSTILIANASLDDDIAYTMVRTIIENIEAMKEENASLRNWDMSVAANSELAGGAPLHPGAERAYREAGLL